MKSFMIFLFLYHATLLAQTPQWTLLRENTSGVIAVDPTNSNIIYIDGVLKTTDGGLTWQFNSLGFGVIPNDIIVDPNDLKMVYVCGNGLRMGIVKSADGGLTWTKSDTGIVTDHHGYSVLAMALDAKRNILYAGDVAASGGVYRSLNGGKYWERLPMARFEARDLLVDQENGTVYAGTFNGVWKSPEQGRTWVRISKGLPINSINPFSGDTLYYDVWSIAKVKQSNTLYAVLRENGIYKSFDAGKNWFSVNNELSTGITFHRVVVSEVDTNIIYVGGQSNRFAGIMAGLLRSTNGGQIWQRYAEGLPTTSPEWLWALHLTMHKNALYLELQGLVPRGIYKLEPAAMTSVKNDREIKIKTYNLVPNYPNPFINSTWISYQLKDNSFAKIKIFDITGKEVITLVEKQQTGGEYKTQWNGKNREGGDVPSGIYFVQLKAGSFIKTHKMVLMR